MTPIYRPPVYGPAPTLEEHREMLRILGAGHWNTDSRWLAMRTPREPCHEFLASVEVVYLRERRSQDGVCYLSTAHGLELLGGPYLWLPLGPDGLPCPIGTPPETERERLERAMLDEYGRMLQAEAEGCCTCTTCYGDDFGAAARALADHIIKETAT